MSDARKMSIAAIKEQVARVEGFNLVIEGSPRKQIETRLHAKKQSSGEMSVTEWIGKNFPDAEKKSITVLFADSRTTRRGTLQSVRASYPVDFRKGAKAKAKAEVATVKTQAQLADKNKKIRQAKVDLNKTKRKTAAEINKAHRLGESGAALEALDEAFRKPNVIHPRVRELCETAISNGLQDTQALIERILNAWSLAERNKDDLVREIAAARMGT